MKILSNKKYKELKTGYDLTNCYRNEIEQREVSYSKEILFYENRTEHILNKLKDMVSPANVKMGKDKYRERVKDLIIFIQGK